jgi:hypothetical protein
MLGYVGVEVWLGAKLRLWHWGMGKDTAVWVLGSGLVLMFNFPQAAHRTMDSESRGGAAAGWRGPSA